MTLKTLGITGLFLFLMHMQAFAKTGCNAKMPKNEPSLKQNKEFMENFPSAEKIKNYIMVLDFSENVITPGSGSFGETPHILLKRINFSKGKIRDQGSCISVIMPKGQYIDKEPGKAEPFPKVGARVRFFTPEEGKGELRITGNCVPDEWGGTDEQASFYINLTLSFTDDTHAIAKGSLGIEEYRAKIGQVKIKLVHQRKRSPK